MPTRPLSGCSHCRHDDPGHFPYCPIAKQQAQEAYREQVRGSMHRLDIAESYSRGKADGLAEAQKTAAPPPPPPPPAPPKARPGTMAYLRQQHEAREDYRRTIDGSTSLSAEQASKLIPSAQAKLQHATMRPLTSDLATTPAESLPGERIGGYVKTGHYATIYLAWARASRGSVWRCVASAPDLETLEKRTHDALAYLAPRQVQFVFLEQGTIPDVNGNPLPLDPSSGLSARAHAHGVEQVSERLQRDVLVQMPNTRDTDAILGQIQTTVINQA